MKTLITGDKSWVYGYNPEKKAEAKNGMPSSEQGESDTDSCLQSQWCCSPKYTLDGQTDNGEYYAKVLCQLHHDNTPAHSSHFVQNFLV
jgi:hypothetical protein